MVGAVSPLDSLLHYLHLLQWSVVPSPIPATQLEHVWTSGSTYVKCDKAVRHLYPLVESGQQAVLEILLKTPPPTPASPSASPHQQQHPEVYAESPSRQRSTRFDLSSIGGAVNIHEKDWEVIPEPYLFAAVDANAEADHTLILDSLQLIPNEVSVLIKHIHQSLRHQEHEKKLKTISQDWSDRVSLLTNSLQELASLKSKQCATVIQGMESIISKMKGVSRVDIYCRDAAGSKRTSKRGDETENHVIYGTGKNAFPASSSSTTSSPTASIATNVSTQSRMSAKEKAKASIEAEKQQFLLRRQQSMTSDNASVTSGQVSTMTPLASTNNTRSYKRSQTTAGRLGLSSLQTSNPSPRAVTGRMTALEATTQGTSTPIVTTTDVDIDDNETVNSFVTEATGVSEITGPVQMSKITNKRPTSQPSKSPRNRKYPYEFKFRVQEVVGSVTVTTYSEITSSDVSMFETIAAAVGRRVYDLYTEEKQRRFSAELEKELKSTR